MKTALTVALILLVVGALLAGAGWAFLQKYPAGKDTLRDTVHSYGVDQAPSSINITTLDSSVEIRPIEGDEWFVVCKETEGRNHTVELVDGVLTIRQNGDARKWYEYIDFLVSLQNPSVVLCLPKQAYEALSVHSLSGSIKVQEGFDFSSATLQNVSGSILCNSFVGGDLNVKNTSGSVQISGGVNGQLDVQNGSGSIQIKGATPTRATIKNISGSIDLIDVVCKEECKIENTSGSIELERCDAAAFDVENVSGSVKGSILSGKIFDCRSTSGGVHVPENGDGGTFKARTTSGGIRITVIE